MKNIDIIKQLICNIDVAMEVDERMSLLKRDLEKHHIKLDNFFNEVFMVFLEEKEQISHWLAGDIFNMSLLDVIKEHIEDYFSVELLNDNCLVVANYNEQHEQTSVYYIYNLDMLGDCIYDILLGVADDLYLFHEYMFLHNHHQIWDKMKNDSECWGTILIKS